jgi:hypothetical protein
LSCVAFGCAGVSRDLSSKIASEIGADWIVVQYRFDGTPINCWKLNDAGISNEPASDGIFWKDSTTGHLVHISGWYNRVQVVNRDFLSAARLVGVDAAACDSGVYRGGQ